MIRDYLSWFYAAAFSAASGLLWASLFDPGEEAGGIIKGIFIASPVLIYERGLLLSRLRSIIRRKSTPLYILLTLIVYFSFFVVGNSVAAVLIWLTGLSQDSFAEDAQLGAKALAFSFVMVLLVITGFRVRDLIGPGTLMKLMYGRYHRPVRESRVFLFLDLVGSTAFSDHHGPLQTQKLLGEVFAALADPVRRHHGTIDDYIGDMAIVSWTIAKGTNKAAAVACVFDLFDHIEADREVWLREFGIVPQFRAALHCGKIVTAEIGLERHKITYFGEAINTTSRLEGMARSLEKKCLISSDLLSRLDPLPSGIITEDLGFHALRGREEPLAVSSLHRAADLTQV